MRIFQTNPQTIRNHNECDRESTTNGLQTFLHFLLLFDRPQPLLLSLLLFEALSSGRKNQLLKCNKNIFCFSFFRASCSKKVLNKYYRLNLMIKISFFISFRSKVQILPRNECGCQSPSTNIQTIFHPALLLGHSESILLSLLLFSTM